MKTVRFPAFLIALCCLTLFTSCEPKDLEPPGEVSDLRFENYLEGTYLFTWNDPGDSDLKELEVELYPVGEPVILEPGTESYSFEFPSSEQVLLLSVLCRDGSGNDSDKAYILMTGEKDCVSHYYYDINGDHQATTTYKYGNDGKQVFYKTTDPDITTSIFNYSDRSDFRDDGTYGRENEYDSSYALTEYRVLSFDDESYSIQEYTYDSSGQLDSYMNFILTEDASGGEGIAFDSDGNPIFYIGMGFDEQGVVTDISISDTDGTLLSREVYLNDEQGRLYRKEVRDPSGQLLNYNEYNY